MRLVADQRIFELYPNLMIGVVVARGVDNRSSPEVTKLLQQAEEQARTNQELTDVKQHPHVAVWREAHRTFGNNPNRYAPSVEAVVKRVVKGGALPAINTLVDLYNYICLKYLVPVGGEDLDRCRGDIWLTRAQGDEPFVGLGDSNNDPPQPGEVVYKDNHGVLCRRFNWREADRTKLTPQTKNAIIVIETLPPVSREMLEKAVEELASLVRQYCGGHVSTYLLDSQMPTLDL